MGKGKLKHEGTYMNLNRATPIDNNSVKVPLLHLLSYGEDAPDNRIPFDILEGSVLKEAEKNRLTIEKDGKKQIVYVHEVSDALYLSSRPKGENEKTCGPKGEGKGFVGLVGKRITKVDKFYLPGNFDSKGKDDVDNDLPINVRLYGEGLAKYFDIHANDGDIDVFERPSMKHLLGIVYEIVNKDKLTSEDAIQMLEVQKEIPFHLFDLDVLAAKLKESGASIRGFTPEQLAKAINDSAREPNPDIGKDISYIYF